MAKKTEEIVEKGIEPIRVLVIVVGMIVSLTCYIYFRNVNAERGYSNTCDTPSSQTKPNNPDKPSSEKPDNNGEVTETNSINLEDGRVVSYKHLFGYEVNTIDNKAQTIYTNVPVIIDDLSPTQKITIALHFYLNSHLIEDSYVKCSELNSDKINFQCNKEGFATANGLLISMYQFPAESLAEDYQNVFGENQEFNKSSFETLDGFSCTINGNQYKCINPKEKPVGINTYSYIIKALDFNDYLEIHTKYVWLENDKGYSNFNHEVMYFEDYIPVSGDNLENIKQLKNNEIYTYKHTFTKSESGKYSWTKTELVN